MVYVHQEHQQKIRYISLRKIDVLSLNNSEFFFSRFSYSPLVDMIPVIYHKMFHSLAKPSTVSLNLGV